MSEQLARHGVQKNAIAKDITNSVRHHGQTSTASLKRIEAERRIATVLHYTLARATCPLTYRTITEANALQQRDQQ